MNCNEASSTSPMPSTPPLPKPKSMGEIWNAINGGFVNMSAVAGLVKVLFLALYLIASLVMPSVKVLYLNPIYLSSTIQVSDLAIVCLKLLESSIVHTASLHSIAVTFAGRQPSMFESLSVVIKSWRAVNIFGTSLFHWVLHSVLDFILTPLLAMCLLYVCLALLSDGSMAALFILLIFAIPCVTLLLGIYYLLAAWHVSIMAIVVKNYDCLKGLLWSWTCTRGYRWRIAATIVLYKAFCVMIYILTCLIMRRIECFWGGAVLLVACAMSLVTTLVSVVIQSMWYFYLRSAQDETWTRDKSWKELNLMDHMDHENAPFIAMSPSVQMPAATEPNGTNQGQLTSPTADPINNTTVAPELV